MSDRKVQNERQLQKRDRSIRYALYVMAVSLITAIVCTGWAVLQLEGLARLWVLILLTAMLGYAAAAKIRSSHYQRFGVAHNPISTIEPPAVSVQPTWKSYYDHLPVPMLFVRHDGKVVGMNPAFQEVTGFDGSLITIGQWMEEQACSKLIQAMDQVTSGGEIELELVGCSKDGFPQDWLIRMTQLPGLTHCPEEEAIFSVSLRDASPNRYMEERIRYMAYYDDMTGLPNRRMFMQRLEESLEMAAHASFSIAVLYMDLDRFKRINDTFGTDFGDMLLMQIADRLLRSMTENDVIARMEGDEFICFMTNAGSEEEVKERVRQLLSVFEEPFELNDIPVHVTMSIGVKLIHEDMRIHDAGLAVQQADYALSRVKELGKNGYLFFVPEMNDRPLERITLEHDMRKALTRGEFELYYQPQVDMSTYRIVGMEALVRWNHPERGLIPPGEFISLAEENGFIVALGTWIMEEACRQNKQWQDKGLERIPVSVNLSVRQFEMNNLTETVQEVLQRTGLEPQYLDLEITESMTMEVSRASQTLRKLKDMGVAISIDDFGTGYSSLHYLKNFPIHRLKIDRSFVRDLQQDPNDAAIVSAIIALGHNMNMQVIAEGVETKEQLVFLQNNQCDNIQGYYFSPPLPRSGFESLFRRYSLQSGSDAMLRT
ncbi:GGDEF domain-containing phosphodiesterase [Paenibacillus sp. NAIST15-1]|uniref:sensor domain-containing protein n=1 Tax=Paenibacillus sp. NAIST15-1 TaxID=1605994 RepID=UPI000ADA825E|nr:GGDEF domain-containing phosphodiesterase [Paenibacillus sp. NAIST15-1]